MTQIHSKADLEQDAQDTNQQCDGRTAATEDLDTSETQASGLSLIWQLYFGIR